VPAKASVRGPRTRQRRRLRVILAVGAGAVGLATAGIAVSITSHGGQPAVGRLSDHSAAQLLLARVAAAASRQPVPQVRDSQYMYVQTAEASCVKGRPPVQWGNGPEHLPPCASHLYKPVRDQTWMPVANHMHSLNDPSYRLLQTLPTDPRALLALISRVERGHGPGPAAEAFTTIGDLLRSTIAPPRVCAALYRAAALIPGVTLVADASDALGRHGVAVALTTGGIRSELIFNRTTLKLIGERTIRASTGVSTSATAIIARAFVHRYGQVPHLARGHGSVA
jgi:hypothetical protein